MISNLVWMDLEMTGLDPEHDVILEMATIVTDGDLNVIAEGPAIALSQPEAKLAAMDDWNTSHHTASGLVRRVRTEGISTTEAEAVTLAFIEKHVEKGQAPLCGNTIWQDRRFLARYMPTLESFLHYRMIDVSTVKELARRWAPDVFERILEAEPAPGARRHPRIDRRTGVLPLASVQASLIRSDSSWRATAQSMCSASSGDASMTRAVARQRRCARRAAHCRAPPRRCAATVRS